MDKNKALEAIKKAKENSKKRNFSQTFDLVINIKNLDLKKPEQQIEFFLTMPFSKGKENKICALVGPELKDEAEKVCDKVIMSDDFVKYKDKKIARKLAQDYDYFFAQANIMAQVAQVFGRVFGPRGKMPNPKAGCVVPPKGALKPAYDKLKRTVKISAKTALIVSSPVGKDTQSEEEVAENIIAVYNQLVNHLPNHDNNIKSIYLKLTMGSPVRTG